MSIRRLRINLPSAPYEVRVGAGATQGLGAIVAELHDPGRAVVIADSEVASLYAPAVTESLEKAGFTVTNLTVPHGEQNKNLEVAGELYSALAQSGLGRDGLVCALGGGVVGDMAGFVAATYLRGVSFVQLPTTLLAMVDASVGGKNAVDIAEGKNLVGTFYQPLHVMADTAFLASLPPREWACGFGEVVKSAVIGPPVFYDWLCNNVEALVAHDQATVEDAIAQCVAFKADVVISDEHETLGRRECLNYGHTFGHALEKVAGFGVYSHGQAVAEGMRFAARLGAEISDTSIDFVEEQDALLDAMGLPAIEQAYSADALCEAMYGDKKVRSGILRFVIPLEQGRWELVNVPRDAVMNHLRAWQASRGNQ